MPVELATATPRFLGVTPTAAVLALAAASLGVGIALLATGHPAVGGALMGVGVALAILFGTLARRVPDTAVSRFSAEALQTLRERAGVAVEALAVHSSARVGLFRLRRELAELLARRAEAARVLGEAVYAADEQRTETARAELAELAAQVFAKEEDGADSRRRHRAASARAPPGAADADRAAGAAARALPGAVSAAAAGPGSRADARAVGAAPARARA